MKVIIAHVSAGAGHTRAAQAIYGYLKDCCAGCDIQIVNTLEKTNLVFKFSYVWGYQLLVRQALVLWKFAFWVTSFTYLRKLARLIAGAVNRSNTIAFRKFLIRENPDVLISTHFLPSEISAGLKEKGKLTSRIITVITDFGVHPFWVTPGTDLYIVASGATKKLLLQENVSEEKIKVLGIPVDNKFFQQYRRPDLAEKFAINPDKFTVLLMTGSFGIGPLQEIAEALAGQAQVLVVCAGNQKLFSRLRQLHLANVKVFAFVQNPEELMAVSDLIITKPGGLSIAEILAMELPPIFISAIPGQERENIKILKGYGVGVYLDTVGKIKAEVLKFIAHPQDLRLMKKAMHKIRQPLVLKEICSVVCPGSVGITG